MKNRLSKFALLFFTFSVFGAIDGFAQEDSCALKLELENLVGGVPVKNAQATAINTENKQVYRSVLKDGNPSFAGLPEGTYDITVTKAGFKQTKESYLHRCANDEEGVSSLSLLMQKGSPKEIYEGSKFKLGSINVNPSARLENPAINTGGGQAVPVGGEQQPDALPRARVGGQKFVSKGVVNGSAISLPKPEYSPAAKAVRAAGMVYVEVTIDEEGNVISAGASGGHPLLHPATLKAARLAKFKPTLLQGKPVKVVGIITYLFVAN